MGGPGWPMLPRGDWVRKPRCPTKELRARTNEDKGKDRQGQVMGRTGKDRLLAGWARTGDGLGRAGTKTGWDERIWMPTYPGYSWAWTPGQKWHKYSLR